MIGKYEIEDTLLSMETTKKIVGYFGLSLYYLTEEDINTSFNKKTLQRLQNTKNLDSEKQIILFILIHTLIRDTKTKKVYS
ncbi:XRE family transcriptional regulator [Tenacibaculum sp. E3R01]|uniref:hypothetical protein n=1 Tax=unclassified Tenacibaculum TaxID=2635139 RepID=UPI0008974349|nr:MULTISPECIES: hypothetical protein [unclassified Tenacibaculum]RBW62317.1 XRE family transcriptional regulator [Tenacibaculum sp. E3R01]SEE29645.1 hypothetical protein SAMN04487765_2045 [Tenacibaculum sp. MAR_2010_89]